MADKRETDYELTIAFNSDDTLVVMDSNVWLNLYTIHPLALIEIVEKIRENKEQFWIPHQVYREFSKNAKSKKDEVIEYYKNARVNCIKELERTKDIVGQTFENFRRKQRTDGEELKSSVLSDFQAVIQKFKNGYEELEKSYTEELAVICEEDIVSELVDEIYENSKTKDFTIMEKAQICEEGEIRYKYKIAPGYTDEEKKSDFDGGDFYRKYGDLIIWKELLRRVSDTKMNTLFIEDEKKKDWFSERGGKKLAPVLYEEYDQATNGVGKIEACNFLAFLENYGEAMGLLEAKINDLIEKLKFEKAVLKYIDEKKDDILIEQIDEHFNELDSIYRVFYDSGFCIFGGTFEDVNDLDITYENITAPIKFEYDRALGVFYLEAEYGIYGSVEVSEYVNRGVSHIGSVDFCIEGTVIVDMAISFEDITREPEDGFDITNVDFTYETVKELAAGEFDIRIDPDVD